MKLKKTLMATIPAALIAAGALFVSSGMAEAADRYVCDDSYGNQVFIMEETIDRGMARHKKARFKFVKNGKLNYKSWWDFNWVGFGGGKGVWTYNNDRHESGSLDSSVLAQYLMKSF